MKKRILNVMMYLLAAILCLPAYAVTPAPKNIFSVSDDGKMVEISQTIITGLYQWEKANAKAESDGYRLLTSDEWTYLLVTRDDEDHYNTGMNNLGQIELTSGSGVYKHGLIILPDGWIQPEGTAFNCVHTGITFGTNSYSYEQWEKMKAAGAVFLPADGYGMNGSANNNYSNGQIKDDPDNVYESGVHGAYWASDKYSYDTESAYRMYYDGENGLQIHDMAYQKHYAYYSVLLVKDVNIKLLDELDETPAMTTRLNAARDDASVMVHRTLYKDGYFNTLCLPFNVPDIEDSPLAGAQVFTFDGGTVTGSQGNEQLNLEVSPLGGRTLTRGVPYLLRWQNNGEVMTMLRFDGVTNWAPENSMEEATSNDPGNENIKYHGLYPRRHIPSYLTGEESHYNFFVDVENSLYWPDDTLYPNSKMKGFRAYFYLQGGGPDGQADPVHVAARYRNMPSSWRIRSTATDLENVQGDDVPCTKVIKNGVLVIRHSGKEYNILGEIIK